MYTITKRYAMEGFMNYDYYRVFLAVGKRGSFTRAAEELYTSQPAVTRTIKNLESELGIRLFVRGKKGVEFTPEGKRLYDSVNAAFQLLEKAEGEVADSASLEKGTIALGSTITALDEFLLDFIESFRLEHPGIKFKICTQSSDLTIAKLRQGLIDIGFVTTPFHEGEGLSSVILKDFDNIVIAGNGYPELKAGVHSIPELAKYPFVYLSSAMQLREYTDVIFSRHGIQISPLVELDSASTIAPMVAKNLGIGIVPKSLVRSALAKGSVFQVALDEPLPRRSVAMLRSLAFPASYAAKRFFEKAKESAK